ncbi:MAG: SprB repeat-containing protein [Cyclobacteriaceae bacterium]|nr:SprB repeat-containing protein [Cyclobacteriaceae bacterium]
MNPSFQKIYPIPVWLLSLAFAISCSQEVDPVMDCTTSGLSLNIGSATDPGCTSPGSVSLTATGGKSPYLFSVDGGPLGTSSDFSSLNAGKHTFSVKDTQGCEVSLSHTLSGSAAISVILTTEGCGIQDGTITVTATGGDSTYQYQLDNNAPVSTNLFTGLNSGNHSVTVTDGKGCSTTSAIQVGASLASNVSPLLTENCAISGCHFNVTGRPNFDSSQNIIAAADRIKVRVTEGTMPPSGPLKDEEVRLIATWVDCGAPDN